jgi:Glycosyltransferase family 92
MDWYVVDLCIHVFLTYCFALGYHTLVRLTNTVSIYTPTTPQRQTAYHHLLGFDHFYFFYRDEVTVLPNWDQLVSNPVVTLIEWNNIGTLASYYNQASGTEVECLTKYAAHHDWVYIADIDEYLYLGEKDRTNDPLLTWNDNPYFSTRINPEENGYIITPFSIQSNAGNDILTVKELLHIYDNMTYLSFGKRQYSLDHRAAISNDEDDDTPSVITNVRIQTISTDPHDSGTMTLRPDTNFIVSQYSYYMNSYFCHHRGHRRGNVICPIWRGRSKVMVRPQYHTFIDVHGTFGVGDLRKPHIHNGTIMHFHPDLYHIKEWPHIYSQHNITIHYPPPSDVPIDVKSHYYIDNYDNFTITNETEVSIHNIHTGYLPLYINEDKEEVFLMKRDVGLHDYFVKVMNLATNMYGYPIQIVPK